MPKHRRSTQIAPPPADRSCSSSLLEAYLRDSLRQPISWNRWQQTFSRLTYLVKLPYTTSVAAWQDHMLTKFGTSWPLQLPAEDPPMLPLVAAALTHHPQAKLKPYTPRGPRLARILRKLWALVANLEADLPLPRSTLRRLLACASDALLATRKSTRRISQTSLANLRHA